MKRSRDTKIDFLEKESVTIHPRCTATRNTPFLHSIIDYTWYSVVQATIITNCRWGWNNRSYHFFAPSWYEYVITYTWYVTLQILWPILDTASHCSGWSSFSQFVFAALSRHHLYLTRHTQKKTIITSSSWGSNTRSDILFSRHLTTSSLIFDTESHKQLQALALRFEHSRSYITSIHILTQL